VPPALHAGSIRRRGAIWEVRYEDEHGHYPVKDFGAFEILAKLVCRPNHPFQLGDLVDAQTRELLERPESSCDVTNDDSSLANLKSRLKEVKRLRDKYPHDPLVQHECDDEVAKITSEMRRAMGPGGRKRKLGSTVRYRTWDALTTKLRRLWPRLREGKMPLLADHLESAIRFEQPSITYQTPVGAFPWDTEG
jgi:hypothetical protein